MQLTKFLLRGRGGGGFGRGGGGGGGGGFGGFGRRGGTASKEQMWLMCFISV